MSQKKTTNINLLIENETQENPPNQQNCKAHFDILRQFNIFEIYYLSYAYDKLDKKR